jgi:hypothetical protein
MPASTIQEIEAANEQLPSANEEILSSGGELQSTNAELTRANADRINLLVNERRGDWQSPIAPDP